jgi:hypothetical protein
MHKFYSFDEHGRLFVETGSFFGWFFGKPYRTEIFTSEHSEAKILRDFIKP